MKKLIILILFLLVTLGNTAISSTVYPAPENKIYTYEQLTNRLQALATDHPDLISLSVLGKSVDKRDIWSVTLGTGEKKILVTGAMHAREWLTAPVLTEIIALYVQEYHDGSKIRGEPVRHILDQYSITFIPMLNPDGVTLVQKGADAFPDRKEELLAMNHPNWGSDFRIWKANLRGVDLNRNFNAVWDEPKKGLISHKPNYAYYRGSGPESEPETLIVTNWVRDNLPELILDYHSMGEYLFWYYNQTGSVLERDSSITRALANESGYTMEPISNKTPNTTLHRWGNSVMNITTICVEIGNKPSHNLNMADFDSNFRQTRYLPLVGILELPSYVPYIPIISVNLPASLSLVIEESGTLTADLYPADASSKSVLWYSNDPDVVAVNERGEFTAISPGSTYITATTELGGRKGSSFITVYLSADEVADIDPPVPASITTEAVHVNSVSLIISKITAGMTAEELLASIAERDYVQIEDGTAEISPDTPLGTGIALKIMADDIVVRTYAVIVTGDTNGDGKITVTDMIATKAHLLGSSTLKGEALYAADTNGDGQVSITDFIQIKSHILGKEAVVAREY